MKATKNNKKPNHKKGIILLASMFVYIVFSAYILSFLWFLLSLNVVNYLTLWSINSVVVWELFVKPIWRIYN